MSDVLVMGSFDDLKSRHMRFLQEASQFGSVHVLLLSDDGAARLGGQPPKFPVAERQYFVEAIRYVDRLTVTDGPSTPHELPGDLTPRGSIWVVDGGDEDPAKAAWCERQAIDYRVIPHDALQGFPQTERPTSGTRRKVLVTGCYDWFHSGHVRFFEEVSELGELYVVVGHDANIRLLKGEGHPMYGEHERRYMAGSIRFVHQSLVSSGDGWLDAEPEIERIQPDIYAVNEDGDRPEKRSYCETHGIEYRVLKRVPKEGLPKRQSTDLRGF